MVRRQERFTIASKRSRVLFAKIGVDYTLSTDPASQSYRIDRTMMYPVYSAYRGRGALKATGLTVEPTD